MPRNEALRKRAEKALAKIAETATNNAFKAKKEKVKQGRNISQKRNPAARAKFLLDNNGRKAATFAAEQMFLKCESDSDKIFWKKVKEILALDTPE